MIKKNKWWHFLGGIFAVLMVVGFISYQAALKAIESGTAAVAAEEISKLKKQAKTDVNQIRENLKKSGEYISKLDQMKTKISILYTKLDAIELAIKKGNPWEKCGSDIRVVVKETDKYEYALFRNKGFRIVTASGWGDDYRVMTEPYMMARQDGNFIVGGSVWIWGTPGEEDLCQQTSCGICGKKMIRDLHQIVTPVENDFEVEIDTIFDCIDKLSQKQTHYQTTRGSHAALIFDHQLEVLSFAEDVGRHNALDKAIGKVFMKGKLSKASLVVLSSRISYELVQKAARAHLPVMIIESRPTALAVEMGNTLNMTLAFSYDESELVIVCGENRIKRE